MPFNPEMKRAIEFSQARISEGCMYDGLLPEGAYIFSAHGEKAIDLKVVPRIQSVRIDLRTKRGKKPKSN
jgi:hypothetical protein